MEKENFINEILNSVNGITKVNPNKALFEKIELHIQDTTLSPRLLWLVAASIAALITINILLINENTNSNESGIATLQHSINKNNQLYK